MEKTNICQQNVTRPLGEEDEGLWNFPRKQKENSFENILELFRSSFGNG